MFTQNLLSCWPPYSQYAHVANLAKSTKTFSKLPQHIAISVVENEQETLLSLSNLWSWMKSKFMPHVPKKTKTETENEVNEIDLQTLAKVISWAWAAHIPLISLYDYHGRLKTRHRELGFYIQEEILQNFWAVKDYYEYDEPPVVKLHNVTKLNGYSNGVNGIKSTTPPLNISIFSNDDGKEAIIRAAKDIIVSENGNMEYSSELAAEPDRQKSLYSFPNNKKLNYESKLDSVLTSVQNWPSSNQTDPKSTEPDLLVILGNIKSTLGFLPWHIRLTEMHWLPTLFRIQIGDFQDVLWKFSRCQQRFGT
jgi:dehydrodolichyl diphosphate syntase complex subunit NUS1